MGAIPLSSKNLSVAAIGSTSLIVTQILSSKSADDDDQYQIGDQNPFKISDLPSMRDFNFDIWVKEIPCKT